MTLAIIEGFASLDEAVPTEIMGSSRTEVEAASLAKNAIALSYLLGLLDGGFSPEDKIELEEHHKLTSNGVPIGGTGILKHFKPGLQLSLMQYLELMIVESDTVAANVLVSYFPEYQEGINDTVSGALGRAMMRTGLLHSDNPHYGSGVASPVELWRVWQKLWQLLLTHDPSSRLNEQLRGQVRDAYLRSHFCDGFRALEHLGSKYRGKLLHVACRNAETRAGRQEEIVDAVLARDKSEIAAKEGHLAYEGVRYWHELGIAFLDNGPVIMGVFSWNDGFLGRRLKPRQAWTAATNLHTMVAELTLGTRR